MAAAVRRTSADREVEIAGPREDEGRDVDRRERGGRHPALGFIAGERGRRAGACRATHVGGQPLDGPVVTDQARRRPGLELPAGVLGSPPVAILLREVGLVLRVTQGTERPAAVVPNRSSAIVRSGYVAAKSIAIGPPSEIPKTTARSEPDGVHDDPGIVHPGLERRQFADVRRDPTGRHHACRRRSAG